jgi:uncharacterized protein (DUF885 family)
VDEGTLRHFPRLVPTNHLMYDRLSMRTAILLLLSLVLLALRLNLLAEDASVRRQRLNDLIAEAWKTELRLQPELATYLGERGYEDKLRDLSVAGNQAAAAQRREFLKRLEAIDTTGLSEQDVLNKELLRWNLEDALAGYEFREYELPINPFNGYHLIPPVLVAMTPFQTRSDYVSYLSRLHALARTFQSMIDAARAGEKDSLMPPKVVLEEIIPQAAALAVRGDTSPFARPVARFPESIPPAEQKRLRAEVLASIDRDVAPAYRRLAAFVKDEYSPRGRTREGVWSLPNGDKYYRMLVRRYTTTDLDPDEIHEIGLKQVAEIETAMTAVAKQLGYPNLARFRAAIHDDRKQYASSREQILGLYRKYTDDMYGKLDQLFTRLPKARLSVIPVEEFREKKAANAEYHPGSPDGSRKGQIVVKTGDFERRTLYDIEATAYHEGVPGHHLQISLAEEVTEIPAFRRNFFNFDAFGEGWALYAEHLGKEVGLYQDPYSEYGRLSSEMFRAIRLVVDTGVHKRRWTRQQMVDYFHAHSTKDEPSIQSEVDRYIVFPGDALAYKIGQLKIMEMRDRARSELGSKFDVRTFHDQLLGNGPLPLDILERRMNAWVQAQKMVAGQQ